MSVPTDDLEPIEDLLHRCEECGAVRANYMTLRQHQGHAHPEDTVEVEGISHKSATDW